MINRENILKVTDEIIQGSDFFLVDVRMKPSGIEIYIDHPGGITVDECSQISRKLQQHFGDEIGEYNLVVSSPGLDMPLKVPKQFLKNIGRKVEVVTSEGVKVKGLLTAADQTGFQMNISQPKGKKIEPRNEETEFRYTEVKTVKIVVEF